VVASISIKEAEDLSRYFIPQTSVEIIESDNPTIQDLKSKLADFADIKVDDADLEDLIVWGIATMGVHEIQQLFDELFLLSQCEVITPMDIFSIVESLNLEDINAMDICKYLCQRSNSISNIKKEALDHFLKR